MPCSVDVLFQSCEDWGLFGDVEVSLCNGIVRNPRRKQMYPVRLRYSERCGPPIVVTMLYMELIVITSLVVLCGAIDVLNSGCI
jgi:hypothetical protein